MPLPRLSAPLCLLGLTADQQPGVALGVATPAEQPGLKHWACTPCMDPDESSVAPRPGWVPWRGRRGPSPPPHCVKIIQGVPKAHPQVHSCHINLRLPYPLQTCTLQLPSSGR